MLTYDIHLHIRTHTRARTHTHTRIYTQHKIIISMSNGLET